MPETRPQQVVHHSFWMTLIRMAKDVDIWRSALLVALFNICLFSYYQLAPFSFFRLGLPASWFGYTGFVLAVGVGMGALVNQYLITKRWSFPALLILASALSFTGSGLVWWLSNSIWFVFAMLLVVMAYGIAIPNILARALRHYPNCMGTAGAILGLMYYLMLGLGLVLSGLLQHLGVVLTLCSGLILVLTRYVVRCNSRLGSPNVEHV